MDIVWARTMYKTTSIFDIPMRVVHYDRVSSDSDVQLNSLANQNIFNEEMIRNNPKWTYAGKYVDEGVSGVSTTKREDFQRLIEDARLGKFDFVITKEISRFARNILDSIRYTRELLSYGVCVFFQNDNINTIEEDSEFRLSIMASVAQEESRKLSSRIKYGHSVSIKNGVILGHDIYGYQKKDKKTLVYDEHYKPMIEYIFNTYAEDTTSANKLADKLYEMGYRSFKGGKISSATIKNIIKNPKYKGYYCGRKVQITDMFTKHQNFLDEDEWVLYKDFEHIPPIVSEDIWDKANDIYKKRGNAVKNRERVYNLENIFTKKIVCYDDGAYYWLKTKKSRNKKYDINVSWRCSHKLKGHCNSSIIYDRELIPIIIDIIKNTTFNKKIIDHYIELYQTVTNGDNITKKINSINSEIKRIQLKKDKILDYNLDGKISDEEFTTRNNEFNKQLQEKMHELSSYKNKSDNLNDLEKTLEEVRKTFDEMKDIDYSEVNRRMVDNLFDKIIAKPIDNKHMELFFILNNGEGYSTKYPRKNADDDLEHMGYMVKKIAPMCHKKFSRYYNHIEASAYDFYYTYSLAIFCKKQSND